MAGPRSWTFGGGLCRVRVVVPPPLGWGRGGGDAGSLSLTPRRSATEFMASSCVAWTDTLYKHNVRTTTTTTSVAIQAQEQFRSEILLTAVRLWEGGTVFLPCLRWPKVPMAMVVVRCCFFLCLAAGSSLWSTPNSMVLVRVAGA